VTKSPRAAPCGAASGLIGTFASKPASSPGATTALGRRQGTASAVTAGRPATNSELLELVHGA